MNTPQPSPLPTDPEGLRELLALYPELRAYLESRDPDARGRRTVAELVKLYLEDQKPALAACSYTQAARHLNLFAASFGERLVTSLTPLDAKRWVEGIPTWKSPWTRRVVNQILQRLFNWGIGMQMIPENPIRGVKLLRGEPRRPMADEEYRALLRHTPPPVRRVLLFMKLTGCRTCEVFDLRWPDVDLARCLAVLPPERSKTGKKTGKPRVLVLVPAAVKLLTWLQRQPREGDPEAVFRNRRGRPLAYYTLYTPLRKARQAAGLPPDTFAYGLRHAFGHTAAKSGANLKTISVLMGHASVQMTEHYLSRLGEDVGHLLDEAQRIVGAMATTGMKPAEPGPAPAPRPVRKQRKRGAVRTDVPPPDGNGKPTP